MSRTWVNGSAPYLNATNLNAMEADITTALGVPDTALAGRINDPASATQAALNATYVPKWQPTTAYTAGQAVLSPAGDTVTAKTSFTSGASFNAANWNYSAVYLAGDPTGATDGQVATWDAASGKFKPRPAPSGSGTASATPTIVLMGDSICASNAGPLLGPSTVINPYNYFQARGFFTWANTFLRQRFKVISNAGIGGQTLIQMAARFSTDVLAYSPGWVLIEGGGNDVTQNKVLSDITTALQSMYTAAKNAGIRVIANTAMVSRTIAGSTLTAAAASGSTSITVAEVAANVVGDSFILDTGTNAETVTVTAQSGTTLTVSALTKTHASGALATNKTKLAVLSGLNSWIENYARNNPNVVLCPLNSVYADPITGGPVAALTIDGTHPTIDGAAYLGKCIADTLDKITPYRLGTNAAGDPANLCPGGSMSGTAGVSAGFTTGSRTGSIATSWTLYAGTGTETVTASKVARTDGVPGEWQQFVISGGGSSSFAFQTTNANSGTDWNVGDHLWAEAEIQCDGDLTTPTGTGPLVDLQVSCTGSGVNSHDAMQAASGSDGSSTIFLTDAAYRTNVAPVPTGTTSIVTKVSFRAASGTIRIGRVRLVKGDL